MAVIFIVWEVFKSVFCSYYGPRDSNKAQLLK